MAQPPHFDMDGAIYFVTTRLKEEGRLLTEYQAQIVQRTILDLSNWEEREEREAKASPTQASPTQFLLTHASENSLKGRGDFSRPSRIRELMLYAYVIMPNHVHILLKPINNGISKTMQLIKGRASRHINQGNLWQKGFFDFMILTEEKFKVKFNYIHYNPVKWGLVERAEDYKYSSAMEYKVRYGEVFYGEGRL